MAEQNTAWLLRQWAVWISEGSGVDLRAKGCMAHIVPSGADDSKVGWESSVISDGDAIRVDQAMAKLNLISPQFHKVLFLTFCFDYSDRRLASYLGVSRWAAASLYEQAYSWIDGELSNYFQSVA